MLQWIDKPGSKLKKAAAIGGMFLAAVFCFYFALNGGLVSAQSTIGTVSQADPNSELRQGVAMIEAPLGLPATDIRQIIANIIRIALSLIGIILLVIIMYGGYLWMTAAGNEEQISQAKKTLTNATIGLIIILSAYAIVLFIMRMLGIETGGLGGMVAAPGTQNFRGSGALGRVIKDHYPARNQTDVPRNTKIVITFFRPIQVDNLALNTNNTIDANNNGAPIIGDCRTEEPFIWETSCDQLILSNDLINIEKIIPATTTTGTPTYEPIRGAAFLATKSVDTNGIVGVYTIVIRPYDYLGSETENVGYRVHLGNGIKRDDSASGNPPIFDGLAGSKYYEWTFTCGTELDLTPPHVTDVYPGKNVTEFKNTVIQISFNEAMDPIGVQGVFATSAYGYYYLQNGFIYLQNQYSTMPIGVFNLVNNYRTLEFTPSVPCGKNACGGTVYCMPVCDKAGASCEVNSAGTKVDGYELIVQAATTTGSGTFESIPFTGVADICGNALDGNNDGKINSPPRVEANFENGKPPDNYWWGFKLKDEMDLVPPIIAQTIPGPEAPWVGANEEWSMWFDKRMRIEPMYYIDIAESPTPQERCDCYSRDTTKNPPACVALPGGLCVLDPLWKVPFVTFGEDIPKTKTFMNHGPFLDGLPQGYIPYVSSSVEDAHFNCLYPGQGPVMPAQPSTYYGTNKLSVECDKSSPNYPELDKCCIVSAQGEPPFCCNGSAQNKEGNPANCTRELITPIQ